MFIPYSARSEIDAAPNFKVLRYFNLLECEVSIYETFSEIRPVTVRDGRERSAQESILASVLAKT